MNTKKTKRASLNKQAENGISRSTFILTRNIRKNQGENLFLKKELPKSRTVPKNPKEGHFGFEKAFFNHEYQENKEGILK